MTRYTEGLENYKKKIASITSQEMVINMGPQHPSTHGVLRLELITDGEVVKDIIPHLGYLHRCFDKHAESMNYGKSIPFTDRLDYLSSMNNSHAFVMGVERMLAIDQKIPKRVEYIRVLVCELNRIASHLIAIGTYGIDIGAITLVMWCFRDRVHSMNMLERACCSRIVYKYLWIGVLYYDIPVDFEQSCKEFIVYYIPRLQKLDDLLLIILIFISRTSDIGVLPAEVAINYGCSGH